MIPGIINVELIIYAIRELYHFSRGYIYKIQYTLCKYIINNLVHQMRAHLRSQFVENLYFDCSLTWAGNEAGPLHLLLDAPHQLLSTKIRRHKLRRRLRPVSPVDDTGEVASLKPVATLSTLCRQTE